MTNPIAVTNKTKTQDNLTNSSIRFWGSVTKNGWEVIAWGFYYYKFGGSPPGTYLSSSTDFGETEFSKFSGNKDPYTVYTFRARIYARKWNVENEEYDYVEAFGDWESVTTHAYCYPGNMYACNINKVTGAVTFYSAAEDNDGGNCVERGFEYGLTRTATWTVKEEGNFAEEVFSLQATGLALNTNFYFRPYCKSASGHVRYHGNVEAGDNWLGGWRKFTTKDLNREWCALCPLGYYGGNAYEFLSVFDENGQEVDCFPIGAGHDTYQVTVCSDGIAYFGDTYGGSSYRIRFIRLSDGASDTAGVSAFVRGIVAGNDGYIYSIEGAYVYKRSKISLTEVGHIPLVGTRYDGIAIDKDGYIYVVHTYGSPDRLEKYNPIHSTYDIIEVVAGESSGSFTIAGDHASEFTDLDDIVITNSTGNNGSYPVTDGGATLVGENTVVPVKIGVPDETVDGDLTKSGSGGRIAYINSPVSLSWAGMAIVGDYVYAGAYFDFPVKASKDLSSIATWSPEGDDWYASNWWFCLGAYKGKILLEGSSNDSLNYNRAIAGYNKDRNLLWFEPFIQGLDGMGGYPFYQVTTEDATQIGVDHAKGNGTAYGSSTKRGFEVKISFSGTLSEAIHYYIAGFDGDVAYAGWNTWEGILVKTVTETGTFVAEPFTGDLGRFPQASFQDKLFAATTYDYRARATIDGTVYYGDWVEFTTASYPAGEGPDEDAVSPEEPIIEPIPEEIEEEELLEWEWPEIVFPEWEWPEFDIPPFGFDPNIVFGKTFGAFLRGLDTKKDWENLREKCIIYQENMNQFALTINHNMLVLKYLINDVIEYVDGDVYPSDLKLMNSSQHLTPLYLEAISPDGFKDIINDFRFKDVSNVYELNQNFTKVLQSLNSLYESDYTTEPISYNAIEYRDIQPTAKRMILQLEDMNVKSKQVRRLIIRNIKRIFTYV